MGRSNGDAPKMFTGFAGSTRNRRIGPDERDAKTA